MTFADLRLGEPILRAVGAEGYTTPTPIQMQAIPHVLSGRDLLGCAQTGTGKTAAFALPILERLSAAAGESRKIRALILSPTRELAAQIGDSFRIYGRHSGLRHTVVFGGVGQGPQERALRGGVDILVATPGRLIDLVQQGIVDLRAIQIFVLDEADRMLDMGFIHAIRQVAARLPAQRQTLMFSATMPVEIRKLAGTLLHQPIEVRAAAVSAPAEKVDQFVYHVAKRDKPSLLKRLLQTSQMERILVFTRTKHGADKVVKYLRIAGIRAEAIHGNKKQNARLRALHSFKSQNPPVLVATDIASRGIDVDGISHVINYDIPNEPETYVHRIGRTGRAGASGVAFSFCDVEERDYLKVIEKLIRQAIPVRQDQPQGRVVEDEKPVVAAGSMPRTGGHPRVQFEHGHAGQQRSERRVPRRESGVAVMAGHAGMGGHAGSRPGRGRTGGAKRQHHPLGKGKRRWS